MTNSKKYTEVAKLVDRSKNYSLDEALQLVKKTTRAKFDETIDLAIKLGVDPKKHSIRGTVSLPAGSGKSKKIAVIAKGDKVKEAEDAGADVVGGEDLTEKIKEGFFGFDVLLATPDMMGVVGKLGKILGTKGLMPNPKSGTVTADIGKSVKEFKSGKVEFKMDKTSALHMVLGKVSFQAEDIQKNFFAALSAVKDMRPSGLKVAYMSSITLSTTMGPGIKVDVKSVQDTLERML